MAAIGRPPSPSSSRATTPWRWRSTTAPTFQHFRNCPGKRCASRFSSSPRRSGPSRVVRSGGTPSAGDSSRSARSPRLGVELRVRAVSRDPSRANGMFGARDVKSSRQFLKGALELFEWLRGLRACDQRRRSSSGLRLARAIRHQSGTSCRPRSSRGGRCGMTDRRFPSDCAERVQRCRIRFSVRLD